MSDERDPNNPLDRMMPPQDNPEYHAKLAEHKASLSRQAEEAILADPALSAMGDRISRVRHEVPQAVAPSPGENMPLAEAPAAPETAFQPSPAVVPPAAPASPVTASSVMATPALSVGTGSILGKLREDFGIDSIPLEDVEINDHIFTMRVLDMASVATALRFADTLSMPGSARENALNLQIALTSFSVTQIDKVPLYEVFNIAVPESHMVLVEGALRPTFSRESPPMEIRMLAATSFMEFLSTDATSSLLSELWDQYRERVDTKATLDSLMLSLEEEKEPDIPLP